jgi:hypothetical protein
MAPDHIRAVVEKDARFADEPLKDRVVDVAGKKVPHVALHWRLGVTAVEQVSHDLLDRRFRPHSEPTQEACTLGLISLAHIEEIGLGAEEVLLEDCVYG